MDKAEIGRVMEMAASIFAEHGFSGVGMRELCSRCGVAAPTIYHYFGSKEKLFEAVCAEKYAEAMSQARGIVNPALPVDRQLDLLCEHLFQTLVHDRVLFLLLRRDLVNGSISGRELHSRRQYDGIIALLGEIVARRPAASEEARRLGFTIAALIFGYCEFVHVSLNHQAADGASALALHLGDMRAAVRKLVLVPD
ncbi:MAG: TetR/AcrR family transcriptional regulator [Panacagrimonas sp.]